MPNGIQRGTARAGASRRSAYAHMTDGDVARIALLNPACEAWCEAELTRRYPDPRPTVTRAPVLAVVGYPFPTVATVSPVVLVNGLPCAPIAPPATDWVSDSARKNQFGLDGVSESSDENPFGPGDLDDTDRPMWASRWATKAAGIREATAEYWDRLRIAEEIAEDVCAGYLLSRAARAAGRLESELWLLQSETAARNLATDELNRHWDTVGRPGTLVDYLRGYGLAEPAKPSQRAARAPRKTRSHTEAKDAQVRARKASLARRTLDARELVSGGAA